MPSPDWHSLPVFDVIGDYAKEHGLSRSEAFEALYTLRPEMDNPRVLNQDCNRNLFNWFLNRPKPYER